MNWMEQRGTLCRYPWLALPTQTGLLGLCLIFATPAGCALFKQCQCMKFEELDCEAQVIRLHNFVAQFNKLNAVICYVLL